jgi:methionyl-tRNA formyltransferase
MRIAFAGTPRFAALALAAILDAGHSVVLVLTQPDRPAGRGLKQRASAVAELARARGVPVLSPASLRAGPLADGAAEALERLRSDRTDLLVVAAYGLILPQAALDAPLGVAGRRGRVRAVNIHASVLPRWRGAAPVARAIEAGDGVTGITLMQMDAGLDTGPILHSASIPIAPTDTAGALTDKLGELGARLIVSFLAEAPGAGWDPVPQPAEGILYARKLDKREAWLQWTESADVLARRVRAFDPEPGACGSVGGDVIKIWAARAEAVPTSDQPGTVISSGAEGIRVACGTGVLVIHELQRAGGRRLKAREFLAGRAMPAGTRWWLPQRDSR